jgi:hypothetical protein
MSASPTFTGTVGAADLTTTGNTILGNASTDTLNVGNGGLIKDASGNVGIGVTPSYKLDVSIASATTYSTAESARFPSAAISSVANTNGTAGNYCINTMTVQGQSAYFGAVAGVSYTPAFVIGRTTAASSFAESMRISSSGGVSIGNTTDPGATNLSVTGTISATTIDTARYYTAKGSTGSIADGVATTIYTVSGQCVVTIGARLVAGVTSPVLYAATATVIYDGFAGRIVSNNGTLLSLTLSGANIQVTQASGATQGTGVRWSILTQYLE